MNRLGILLLLLVAGTLGMLAWPGAGPDLPITPPPVPPPDAGAPAGESGGAPAPDDPDAVLPERVLGSLADPSTRADVELAVRLEQQAGATRVVLPGVEIGLHSQGTTLVARSGADGIATFVCRGGDGLPATVRCVLGAEMQITLRAATIAPLVLVVRPRVRVRGTVTDLAGNRIPQASIVLLPWSGLGDDSPAPRRIGQSGTDGSFEVDLGVGGRLGAQHRLYAPSAMHLVQAPGSAAATLPIVTVPLLLASSPAELSGTVHDVMGNPVAAADLEFRSGARVPAGAELAAVPQRVRTNADGSFVAPRLPPGPVQWGVRAAGHGALRGVVKLQPGEAQRLTLRLPPACELVGSVHHADGTPAAASVLVDEAEGFPLLRTQTAADGSFRLTGLAPGRVQAVAKARGPGGLPAGTVRETRDVRPGGDPPWLVVLPATGVTANLRGRIVDSNGRPLAGWQVVAIPHGSTPVQGRSDGSGAFALATPPDRKVDLRVYSGGQPALQWAAAVWRDIVPRADLELRVAPPPPGQLQAHVTAANRGGIPASLGCWHHERAEYVTLTAREDGLVLQAVPPGTLDIVFSHPGQASTAARDLTVRSGEPLDLGAISLGAGGSLFGQVRGPDGNAPDDCQLAVVCQVPGQAPQRFTGTYTGGGFRFPTLPVGDHVLLAQSTSFAATQQPVTIVDGADTRCDVDLAAGVKRHIEVVLPDGAPSSCTLAFRTPRGELQWVTLGSVLADTKEERRIGFDAVLAPGSYRAVAWAGERFKAEVAADFTAATADVITLALQPR